MLSLPLCSRSYWTVFNSASRIATSYSKFELFPSSSWNAMLGFNSLHHYRYQCLSTNQIFKRPNEVKEGKYATSHNSQNQNVFKEKQVPIISAENIEKSKYEEELADWTQIYSCNQIVAARLLQRFKIAQTVFTLLCAAPLTISGFVYEVVEIHSVYMTLGASVLASTMLYIVGNFFSRLIGRVYISKLENPLKTIRIARLDFWGGRVDEFVAIKNIVPLSEYVDNYDRAYVKVKQLTDDDDNDAYNITFKYGKIIDEEKFERIFGGLPPT